METDRVAFLQDGMRIGQGVPKHSTEFPGRFGFVATPKEEGPRSGSFRDEIADGRYSATPW